MLNIRIQYRLGLFIDIQAIVGVFLGVQVI